MSRQIFFVFFITFLAGVSMVTVAYSYDPFRTTEGIKILFFLSFFAFIWGAGTIAFFILNLVNADRWTDSFRRGLLLSALFTILIIFKRHDVLSWYVGSIIGGLFIVFEIWVYKRLSKRNSEQSE